MQMAELMRAGLGRKELHIIDDGDSSDIHSEIMYHFPKLRDAGGYELMRISDENRSVLQSIPPLSEGYTVAYLKEVVRQAKVYIRPLQRNLNLDQVPSCSNTFQDYPSEKCMVCSSYFPLQELSDHIRVCKSEPSMEEKSDDDGCLEITDINYDLSPVVPEGIEVLPESSALNEMPEEPCSLNDIISQLSLKIGLEEVQIQVGRETVLEDLLLLSDSLIESCTSKRMTVSFRGEPGIDIGGVTREMWSLFAKGVESLCDGRDTCKVLRHNTLWLVEGVYRKLGMLMGICIIQSGIGFAFFSSSIYKYLSGARNYQAIVPAPEEIPDQSVLTLLNQLSLASDDLSVRKLAIEDCDTLLTCGYLKPIHTITCRDVNALVAAVSFHCVIATIKGELDDIRDGLSKANILNAMEAFPDMFKVFFVKQNKPLAAAELLDMFKIKIFSEPGSSSFQKEQATYTAFCNILREMEKGSVITSLSQFLSFFTGASEIPATGFDTCFTLRFSEDIDYPTATTCSLSLTLPVKYYDNYDVLRKNVLFAVVHHGGFGLY